MKREGNLLYPSAVAVIDIRFRTAAIRRQIRGVYHAVLGIVGQRGSADGKLIARHVILRIPAPVRSIVEVCLRHQPRYRSSAVRRRPHISILIVLESAVP